MRSIVASVVIVAFAALATGADDEKYKSKEGKFAVAFPADAKVKAEKQDAGGLKLNSFSVEAKDKAYMVMYMDFPAEVKDVPAKQILDAAEKGMVDKSGGKKLESNDLEFGPKKFPTRETIVEKDGNKIRTRIILAASRAYVVIVAGPKDFATSKDADKFLESFEISK